MPTYTYRCTSCQDRSEVQHSIKEDGPKDCHCGGALRRTFSPPLVQFKGSGFYKTDSRR